MEAAAQGACERARMTVGVMKEAGGANAAGALGLRIWTGLGDGRNYVNAAASDVMIALAGEAGTLSEIALALKLKRRVYCCLAWEFLKTAGFQVDYVRDPETAVSGAFNAVGADPGGFVAAPITYPRLPEQSAQVREFTAAVEAWSRL
jgi:SLOG cluster4 family